jgi:hypothetical protein
MQVIIRGKQYAKYVQRVQSPSLKLAQRMSNAGGESRLASRVRRQQLGGVSRWICLCLWWIDTTLRSRPEDGFST